jgi:hypothetical protein
VVFAGECLVAAGLGTDERSLLVVASHVCLEATWSVEALRAGRANVVPLATGLALCPQSTIVGEIDFVISRVVRSIVLLESILRSTSENVSSGPTSWWPGYRTFARPFLRRNTSLVTRFPFRRHGDAYSLRAVYKAARRCGELWSNFQLHSIFRTPRFPTLAQTPTPAISDRELSLPVASHQAHTPYFTHDSRHHLRTHIHA